MLKIVKSGYGSFIFITREGESFFILEFSTFISYYYKLIDFTSELIPHNIIILIILIFFLFFRFKVFFIWHFSNFFMSSSDPLRPLVKSSSISKITIRTNPSRQTLTRRYSDCNIVYLE